jgi:hypothetical protein
LLPEVSTSGIMDSYMQGQSPIGTTNVYSIKMFLILIFIPISIMPMAFYETLHLPFFPAIEMAG